MYLMLTDTYTMTSNFHVQRYGLFFISYIINWTAGWRPRRSSLVGIRLCTASVFIYCKETLILNMMSDLLHPTFIVIAHVIISIIYLHFLRLILVSCSKALFGGGYLNWQTKYFSTLINIEVSNSHARQEVNRHCLTYHGFWYKWVCLSSQAKRNSPSCKSKGRVI